MITIHIPENPGELEQLVGKIVGVIVFDHTHTEPHVLLQRAPFPRETQKHYEFIRQAISLKNTPSNAVVGLIAAFPNSLEFLFNGIRLYDSITEVYTPKNLPEEYNERLKLLKQNNQWREPRE